MRTSAAFSILKLVHNASSHITLSRSNAYCKIGKPVKSAALEYVAATITNPN